MNKKTLKTLSERLVYALDHLQVSQTELANRLNINRQAIYYLCTANAQHSRFTYAIAQALGINGQWLAQGQGIMLCEEATPTTHAKTFNAVPLLALEQIQAWLAAGHPNTHHLDSTTLWLTPSSDLGTQGFACRLPDQSLFPRFDPDTLFFVSPEDLPKQNRFVVAYLQEINAVVIRQYEQHLAEPAILKPINTKIYNTVVLTPDDKILGVILEAHCQL